MVFLPDSPHFTVIAASLDMCRFLRMSREEFVGKSVFDAFPDNPDDPAPTGHKNLAASLEYVLRQKAEHRMERQRYDISKDGVFEETYWENSSVPVLNAQGDVVCIIHTAEDITEKVKAELQEQRVQGIEKAYHLFMQAPMVIGISKGKDHVLELANENALKLWGRTSDIIGKPLPQSIPELGGQGIFELFDTVLETGKPYVGKEIPIVSVIDGQRNEHYFDVIYQPYYEEGSDRPTGVFTVSYEVTEGVLTRKKLEEKEQSLALAVEIGQLGVFHVDLETDTGYYSPQIMEWFGFEEPSLPLSAILSRIDPQDRAAVSEALDRSIAGEGNGRHDLVYRLVHPITGKLQYLRSIGQVKYDNGKPVSISGIIQDETEQMLSIKKIEESEEQLRFALDAGHLGSWELDLRTMALDASPHCKSNFGQPVDRPFTYETLQACIHPDDRQRQHDAVMESISSGREYDIDYRAIWPDNSVHWINIRGLVQAGADGKPERMIGISIDITEEVTTRLIIEENEAKYRRLFQSMDQGFCIIEMIFDADYEPCDYRFIETNPVFEEQTGLKGAVGKTARELVPGLEKHWFELYGKVALSGEPMRFTEGSVAMGRMFDVYAFRGGSKNNREVAVLFTDITQRKLSEMALMEKDANLRNIVHQAPVAMFIFRGENMVIETANERALEMIRRTEEAVGKPLLEVIPELKDSPAYDVFQEVYRTGIARIGNEMLVPLERNGVLQDCYFNFTYTPLMEAGNVVGVMDVATEVTEQVLARQEIERTVMQRTLELAEANEELLKINKELKRSNQNLEEFAHAASHDLKEPVRKIHFFTNRLKEQLAEHLNETEARSFVRIESATQRMGALIDDLLLYSHVSQRPHEMEAVDLNDSIRRVLEDLELDIQEKNAVIHVDPLPVVQGYRRQLQQLFQNLISNALKYSKESVAPVIAIKAGKEIMNGAEYYALSVKDNGIGFEQGYADKIFQMFTRLHGKAEYSGTGVGLSIVKKVVENHNGFIAVESAEGEGSLFKIYLRR